MQCTGGSELGTGLKKAYFLAHRNDIDVPHRKMALRGDDADDRRTRAGAGAQYSGL
jgi:hypothetical protein